MAELPPPPERPRRQRAPSRRPALDQATIVDAALHVLDAEGLDAVTIRRVAEEAGTSGAALYGYVRDKDELVDLLLDRVIGEFDLTMLEEDAPWQQQLRMFMREGRRVFGAHRDIARASLGRVPQGERALVVTNAMVGIMRNAGLPDLVTSLAADLLALYMGAVAYEESLMAASGANAHSIMEFVLQLRAYLQALPPDRFPHLVALAEPLTTFSPERDDRFEFGLDVLIAGIEAQASPSQ
ncbi:MAG TPA: TetR/AcrR family transcriptional regulator [Gaiellaceae bacterium]|nr:TetR/AcrR family transcriptional regulator [Gaiellaceae bacterium]